MSRPVPFVLRLLKHCHSIGVRQPQLGQSFDRRSKNVEFGRMQFHSDG